MKIALLTIFHVPNYGAMLQCYSLAITLKEMGHDVFLYDVPMTVANDFLVKIKRALKLQFMTEFIDQHLPRYTENLAETADAYIIGSDQVWNYDIVANHLPKFMFSFVANGGKKFAFAASFGVEKWLWSEQYDQAKQLLSQFTAIATREDTGVNILKDEFGIDGTCVLDPCFLRRDFKGLIGETPTEKKHLTTFKLVYSYQWYKEARLLSKSLACDWIELCPRYVKCLNYVRGFNVHNPSVKEWVTSIATAKYVVTDSFHGTVFCLIFKRQFVVLPSVKGRSTRLVSLLSKLGLQDRILDNMSQCKSAFDNRIDYSVVTPTLEKLQDYSRNVLQNMLSL